MEGRQSKVRLYKHNTTRDLTNKDSKMKGNNHNWKRQYTELAYIAQYLMTAPYNHAL